MDARKTRIRILDLLDGHCQSCEYHGGKIHPYCTETCKIGQEIQQLGASLITDGASREYKTKVEWDQMCQDVMELKKEGLTYVQIAGILRCNASTIHQQLKKRGLQLQEIEEEMRKESDEKWDELCKQAVTLHKQGKSYEEIARQFGYHGNILSRQLIKRGLYQTKNKE
ncbi:hypothetical protein [Bacillus thuringiensis]|uniref:hypothetical protein n=1 Tax=Bacillus thuringiensis TaxID=1428 RepID=UPI003B9876D3